MLREIILCLILAATCLLIGFALEYGLDWKFQTRFTALACALCLLATLLPLWLRSLFESRQNGAAFPVLTMAWRGAVILVPIVWAAATKWPEVKIFSLTILGCYFPFLALESALSITRIRRDSGPIR
jgi:hypothetical protein